MPAKVTIIGGGSSSFVPILIRRLMQSPVLGGAHVTLMDIDEGRLGVMQALAGKLIESERSELTVSSTEWLAAQAGVEPERIAMPPVVAGINHCASVTELRLTDGTDAMPLVRERATEPIVRWALDRYGVLPYCWSHWTEFFPQMQRLEAPYTGTAHGVAMRYGITTHDMEYERGRVRSLEQLAATWTAADAGPVTLADLPAGDEDWGIEVIAL